MDAALDPLAIKAESEAKILAAGGKVCEWLPVIDPIGTRNGGEVADRMLAMHAMVQLPFGAPVQVVSSWLSANGLWHALSAREREILADKVQVDGQRRADLYWYIQALWAFAWIGALTNELSVTEPVKPFLASLLPDLRHSESAAKFRTRFAIRQPAEIYPMLDLYYRAHWFAKESKLAGLPAGAFDLDAVMERRKALEWT